MDTAVMVRLLRSAGEVSAICRQLVRCAEDVTALGEADPVLAPEAAALNGRLHEASEAARSMMAVLEARLELA